MAAERQPLPPAPLPLLSQQHLEQSYERSSHPDALPLFVAQSRKLLLQLLLLVENLEVVAWLLLPVVWRPVGDDWCHPPARLQSDRSNLPAVAVLDAADVAAGPLGGDCGVEVLAGEGAVLAGALGGSPR